MIRIVIPGRAGSKGFPDKNKKLLGFTLNQIPSQLIKYTYLNTDDIIDPAPYSSAILTHDLATIGRIHTRDQINIYQRPKQLAEDHVPIRPVLDDIANNLNWNSNDIIIMLYLTYPRRKWDHVYKALRMFQRAEAKSLLCRKPVKSHPYLCMFENGIHGEQIIPHDLHRRQDYPECFEICHYIAITRVNELRNLKNNIFNENTIYYSIPNPDYYTLDVDTKQDFNKFLEND